VTATFFYMGGYKPPPPKCEHCQAPLTKGEPCGKPLVDRWRCERTLDADGRIAEKATA